MIVLKRLSVAVLLAGSAVLAACSDTLSPDTVDPQQLNAGMQTLASTFDNNAAFQALKNLSPHFPQYSATHLLRAGMPDADGLRGGGRFAPRVAADPGLLADLRAPGAVHALFPSDVLGKTLVWDTLTNTYVVGAATGAPTNGVRIILYVADPSTGLPFVPLQPIGNLDLTDESTAQANKLGVLLRLGGATIADYDITVQTATSSATVRAVGFVRTTDGSYQADFDFLTVVTFSTVHLTYQLSGSDGTAIYLDVNAGQASAAIVFRVSRARNTIEIAGTDDGQTVSGTVKFNGTTVGTISGPSSDPVITGAGGRELSAEQVTALGAIFQTAAQILGGIADGIYGPATVVFGSL